MIYFDNAATTYPKPEEVYEALDTANRNAFNTGRGSYKPARDLTKVMDEVREKILKLNNINGKVAFTSSATQALNNIIFGIDIKDNSNIYVTPFEHNSVIRPLYELKKKKGINIYYLPFNKKTWELDEEKTENMFAMHNPDVILLTHVNNVTGYIMDYAKIFEKSEKYKSINILDCSQSYGIIKVDVIRNVNYIVFAGHKSLYASFGIAGYIKLKDDKLFGTIYGGTGSDTMNHEMPDNFPNGYEAGSPNIVAICGLSKSIDWVDKTNIYKHEKELTDYLIEKLKNIKKCHIFIPENTEKIFGIVSIGIEGYSADEVGQILDEEYSIYVRTGYHCGPDIHDFIDSIVYNGTVRISLGYFNDKKDVDAIIDALQSL